MSSTVYSAKGPPKIRVHFGQQIWQSWLEIDGLGFPCASKLAITPDPQHPGQNELWVAIPMLANVEVV